MSAFLLGLHSTTHWESKCTCKAAKSGHPHGSTVETRMNWMLGESGFQSLRWAKESIFGIKYSFIFSCKITLYTNSPPCLPVRYHEFGYHPKWYPKCVLLTLTEPPLLTHPFSDDLISISWICDFDLQIRLIFRGSFNSWHLLIDFSVDRRCGIDINSIRHFPLPIIKKAMIRSLIKNCSLK